MSIAVTGEGSPAAGCWGAASAGAGAVGAAAGAVAVSTAAVMSPKQIQASRVGRW